jgi:hypothetical protein
MEASNPSKDGNHGGRRESPDEVQERAIRFALDLVDAAEKPSVNALPAGR